MVPEWLKLVEYHTRGIWVTVNVFGIIVSIQRWEPCEDFGSQRHGADLSVR